MRNLLIIILSIITSLGWSQDKIELRNGETLDVKVLNINEKTISYKLTNYLDGPTYEMSHSKVIKVTYPNGEIVEFEEGFGPGTQLFNQYKNGIELVASELIGGRISLAFSRQIGNKFELRLHGAYMATDNFDLNHFGGIQFLYHPMSYRKLDFYTGIGTRVGNYTSYNYYPYYDGYYYYETTYRSSKAMGTIEVVNGVKLHFNQRFALNAGISAGIGIQEGRGATRTVAQGIFGTVFKF